jgi:hypothetical protein
VNSLTSSNLPGTGFSLFFRLLVAYHLKDLEDLHDNNGAASAALTIAGGRNAFVLRNEHGLFIKMHATAKGFRFNLWEKGVSTKLEC